MFVLLLGTTSIYTGKSDAVASVSSTAVSTSAQKDGPAYPLAQPAGTASPDTVITANYAGYTASGSTFSKAHATYVVPKVTCQADYATVDMWVGLEASNNSNIEQAGVAVICSGGPHPSPTYSVFTEMWPLSPQYSTTMAVSPGDTMTSKVSYSSSTGFVLKVTNDTTDQYAERTARCPSGLSCDRGQVDWMAERAQVNSSTFYPLAEFQAIPFESDTAATGTTNYGISHYHYVAKDMDTLQFKRLVTVSGLSDNGEYFLDQRE